MKASATRVHDGGRPAVVVFFVCAIYVYVLAALLAWASLPVLTGLTPTLIISGSMEPSIHAGDLVLVRSDDGAGLAPGAVVTFVDPAHEGRLLTHRVVSVNPDGSLRTRGDANDHADSSAVPTAAVRGVGKFLVPAVGVPLMWIREQAWLQLALWVGGSAFAASYLRLYGRHIPVVSSWSTSLRPGVAPAPNPSAPRPRRRGWETPVVARRRIRPGVATAVVAGVAVLALAAAVGPQAVASEAAFTAVTKNQSNSLRALTLQPPTGFTVTQQCTQSAPVALRAATSAEGEGGTHALSIPLGVAASDVLLAQIVTRDNVALTAPSGWTFLRKDGSGPYSALYYRIASASEPATATWTSSSSRWAGGMGAWSGAHRAAPIVTTSGAAGTLAAPSVTTTRPKQTLVAFHAQMHDGGFTPPAGMTERWDRASMQAGSSSHQVGSTAADERFVAVGATGTRTATGSGGGSVAQMVLLDRTADSYLGYAQWTATTTTSATGHRLQRSRGVTLEATYDVSPRTTVTQVDSGLAAATTYSYTLAAYQGLWKSANASGTLTTSAYCP